MRLPLPAQEPTPPGSESRLKIRSRSRAAPGVAMRAALPLGSSAASVAGQHNRVSGRPSPSPEFVIECEDNLSFMSRLEDGVMQLIVTSPPYNLGKAYERRSSLRSWLDGQKRVIAECVRLLHERGSLCWQVGNYVENGEVVPLDTVLYPIFRDFGLRLRNRIVWHFGHGLHCSKRLSGRYETINWWTRGDDYKFDLDPIRVPSKYPGKRHFKGPKIGQLSGNPKGKNPSDVWVFPNVKSNHIEKTVHPCQFPVELVERLVLALTEPGDAVLDPYLGVGSSVIAALRHGRRFRMRRHARVRRHRPAAGPRASDGRVAHEADGKAGL